MKKTAKPIAVKAKDFDQNSSAFVYQLLISDHYKKRLKRFLKQHPELSSPYFKTTALLQANPFHPSLRMHALSGKLQGLHSVSINLSYRITLEFLIQDRQIILINVGDQDAVYH